MAAIVFDGKSLRSPSSFGHEVWEVDIWMISNFPCLWWKESTLPVFISCLWGQKSALGLHLVMKTERRDLFVIV
jgi:hypothetical protein